MGWGTGFPGKLKNIFSLLLFFYFFIIKRRKLMTVVVGEGNDKEKREKTRVEINEHPLYWLQ